MASATNQRFPRNRVDKMVMSQRFDTDHFSNELSNQRPKSVMAYTYFKGRNTGHYQTSQGRIPGQEYMKSLSRPKTSTKNRRYLTPFQKISNQIDSYHDNLVKKSNVDLSGMSSENQNEFS